MTKGQVNKVIKYFESGGSDLKFADELGVDIMEFSYLLEAYRAVKGHGKRYDTHRRLMIGRMMEDTDLGAKKIAKIFGCSENNVQLAHVDYRSTIMLQMKAEAKRTKKKFQRTCGSGVTFEPGMSFWR